MASGEAKVTCDKKSYILKTGESIKIPIDAKHRLENTSINKLHLVELQFGTILSEEDIIRYEDQYGRES